MRFINNLGPLFDTSLDFFAISSGDGWVKIWDILKGQIQTEITDIISMGTTNLYSIPEKGHFQPIIFV